MIKLTKKVYALFVLSVLFLFACSSNEGGVGTVVKSPTETPTKSYAPLVTDHIDHTPILESSLIPAEYEGLETDYDELDDFQEVIFETGEVLALEGEETFIDFDLIQLFDRVALATIATTVEEDGLTILQTTTFAEAPSAFYRLQVDEDQSTVKGIFGYINVDSLDNEIGEERSGHRMILIAFDYTQQDDPTNKIVARVETFDEELDYYVVYHIFYQCNVETNICVSELVKIDSPLGEREFSEDNARISWDKTTSEVCYTSTANGTDEAGACNHEPFDPFWGEQLSDNLPIRYGEGVDALVNQIHPDEGGFLGFAEILTMEALDLWMTGEFE